MQSDLNHILSNKELKDQLIYEMDSDEAKERLRRECLAGDKIKGLIEGLNRGQEAEVDPGYEAIIRKWGRPVLYIQDDAIEQPRLELWKARLEPARQRLQERVPRIGRVELRGHPRFSWVGTGWLVAPRVIVTNRHVAEEFARATNGGFDFRTDPVGRSMRAWIDMYQEHQRPKESEFSIKEILHIEEEPGPDMAFMRVAPVDQDDRELPAPIALCEHDPLPDQVVGVIGYAAWDGDRNDRDVMDRIFDRVYEVKRLHPGELMDVPSQQHYLTHDCSTLGGNSGSVVLDFATGNAVALHYAGRYEGRNYAVKASSVRAKMDELGIDPAVGV
jgi:endonuclease G, mitochondrial